MIDLSYFDIDLSYFDIDLLYSCHIMIGLVAMILGIAQGGLQGLEPPFLF